MEDCPMRVSFLLSVLLLAGPVAAQTVEPTLVLTNEGGLIDRLIATGHGSQSLYAALQYLQPSSGGAIAPSFMTRLAACPPGSEVLTAPLSNYTGLNNPVAIQADGTLGIAPLFGRDYRTRMGYTTTASGGVLFTSANSAAGYIWVGTSGQTEYRATGIIWGAATAIVLTNEGGLIDRLIAMGYGADNLYQTLVVLGPSSGGAITEAFLERLANAPAGSEAFTARLSDFAGLNNPVAIGDDGALNITSVHGRDYRGQPGYATYAYPTGQEAFTYATGPAYYIDTGVMRQGGDHYYAITIVWIPESAPPATPVPPTAALVVAGLAGAALYRWRKCRTAGLFLAIVLSAGRAAAQHHAIVLTNEGGLIDNLIAAGRGSQSLYTVLQALQPDSYGFIHANFMAELAALPASSEVRTLPLSAFAGANNPVAIANDGTLFLACSFGRDYVQRTGWTLHNGGPGTFSLGHVMFGNAANPDYHQVLESDYEQIAIVWSLPTFTMTGVALSNEGGLIDRLVAGGYGSRPVYDALQHLQPISQGAISEEFMSQLAAAPRTRDAFTAELWNLASPYNNPVVVSPDGEIWMAGVFGQHFRSLAGFQTASGVSGAAGTVLFTFATGPQYYIDAGATVIVEAGRSGHFYYKAMAIVYADPPAPPATPIPPTAVLVAMGLAGAGLWRWRARRG
jgi:hypothetical protein